MSAEAMMRLSAWLARHHPGRLIHKAWLDAFDDLGIGPASHLPKWWRWTWYLAEELQRYRGWNDGRWTFYDGAELFPAEHPPMEGTRSNVPMGDEQLQRILRGEEP